MQPSLDARDNRYVLTLGCPDRRGIIAMIASFVAGLGGSIAEAGYHADPHTGWFFTRQAILASSVPVGLAELQDRFADVATALGPETDWQVHDSGTVKRVVLLVSREQHCLHDLLGRAAAGELPATIEAVVGNHERLGAIARAHDVPFHHVPFVRDPDARATAFAQVAAIVDGYRPDAVVLARFMQVLPPELCRRWAGRAINIHHSFLPSFSGARPYHQAFDRGVKLIGATCHYVTAELDAGPIIEQDVIRIDHSDDPASMVRQGRDIERLVLARGLRWHLEGRVLVHGVKTVVFT
ncbi:formyltetrahydrofolate deformylase [Skermania piniformis]|uniref:formyltetrahydrofolate deformylase n=1 Tax=Skermania pinensis TaxID=39122 RepID=UPI001FEB658C|nr:formyltetrahydrofolate deformylase [Skermania piniformis]